MNYINIYLHMKSHLISCFTEYLNHYIEVTNIRTFPFAFSVVPYLFYCDWHVILCAVPSLLVLVENRHFELIYLSCVMTPMTF